MILDSAVRRVSVGQRASAGALVRAELSETRVPVEHSETRVSVVVSVTPGSVGQRVSVVQLGMPGRVGPRVTQDRAAHLEIQVSAALLAFAVR